MARLVLSDASVLIGLARVDGLCWLHELFQTVEITPAIEQELMAGHSLEPAIMAARQSAWLTVRSVEAPGLERPPQLGRGEWSTILAALAHQDPVLVLMDDRLARREAQAAGLTVSGTAAIVVMAARRGLTPSARDVFERLHGSDFRIAPSVIRAALDAAGED